ncbi:hypothetical protein [Clostridium cadaveris]|uniref:hypothetical protein n=2 Tax=Clostridium cadaveris TaxID=1529 RepID=UPI000C088AFC|nr:hypothetical protein [Clostridium cadaveris]NWK13014.1 hypothetical protein [Clostridium cadaveris]
MSYSFKIPEINNIISKQIDINNRIMQTIPKIPTYDFSNIYKSLEPFQSQLILISQQSKLINSSIKPFQDYMSSINEMINKNLQIAMPKVYFEYLNNLKILSSYYQNILESIDESLFTDTIDEICTSLDSFEADKDSIENLDECKNSFFDLKHLIQKYSLTKEDFYFFITLLISLFTIIQPYLDNSSDVLIKQQKEIIELQKEKLDTFENINDSFKNVDVTIENISKSLENLIESIEH